MKTILLTTLAALSLTMAVPAIAKDKACPPGLAKKSPSCVPPGLAKKGVTSEDWQGERVEDDDYSILAEGDRVIIDGQEYIVVDTDNGTILRRGDDWYRLPRDANTDYVRVGDAIVQVDRETKQVIDWIRLTDLIFG